MLGEMTPLEQTRAYREIVAKNQRFGWRKAVRRAVSAKRNWCSGNCVAA
jgi:hypothetical protein